MNPEFSEVQKFRQWWLWLVLAAITCIPLSGIYKQVLLGETFGERPVSNTGLFFFLIFMTGVMAFFGKISLKTFMNENEIRIDFQPVTAKKIKWDEIRRVELVNYGFTGYGVRFNGTYGTIYNVSGNSGLAIELMNGGRLLIGTNQKEKLYNFLLQFHKEKMIH
jgi:hypothetical protein